MLQSKRNQKSAAMAALMGDIDAQLSSLRQAFAPGEKVKGKVVTVGEKSLFLDINSTLQGVLDKTEFEEEEVPRVGDDVEAYFIENEDGAARLTLRGGIDSLGQNDAISSAYATKLPIEGKFEKEVNGGYEVTISGQRAFCPYSQVASYRPREGAPSPVGNKTTFVVIEFNPSERTLVVSHRAVEEKEREQKREAVKATLFEGDIRHGKVTKILPFGVFVDIGGVEGLIPNSEISWDRSVKPGDILKEGDSVSVKVRKIDWDANRISFSLKDLSADPWQEWLEDFGEGSRVSGTVTKLMPFGAFVQLVPGVDGLIPISRLGNGRHIVDPGEAVKVGEELDLKVESVDPVAKRISLSLVNKRVEALKPGQLAVGAEVDGIVESVRNFGVFVRLSEEKTGLLHASETGTQRGSAQQSEMEKKFPIGSDVKVLIKGMEGDRISLSIPEIAAAKAAVAAAENAEPEDFGEAIRKQNKNSAGSGLGNLGSLLSEALAGK